MDTETRQIIDCQRDIKQSIDIINIDDIANSIKSLALEIEDLPCKQHETKQVKKQMQKAKSLELPCAPSAEAIVDSNCYFKTKSGGYKKYELRLTEDSILFNRPKSSKQQDFSYALNKVQVLIRYTPVRAARDESEISGEYCLNIISSPTTQRSVYFCS